MIIAGNWKMHLTRAEAGALARDLAARKVAAGVRRLVFPADPLLDTVRSAIEGTDIGLGGQNCHEAMEGAHTGDVSPAMLVDSGCSWVLLGHSERRLGHGESDAVIAARVKAAQEAGLRVILCVGETATERNSGHAEKRIREQLEGSLPERAQADRLAVAYEPVWAIGSGQTATGDDISAMHGLCRRTLGDIDPALAACPILYGGSVKPDNAAAIFATAVDGVLVGGVSLDAEGFHAICRIAADFGLA